MAFSGGAACKMTRPIFRSCRTDPPGSHIEFGFGDHLRSAVAGQDLACRLFVDLARSLSNSVRLAHNSNVIVPIRTEPMGDRQTSEGNPRHNPGSRTWALPSAVAMAPPLTTKPRAQWNACTSSSCTWTKCFERRRRRPSQVTKKSTSVMGWCCRSLNSLVRLDAGVRHVQGSRFRVGGRRSRSCVAGCGCRHLRRAEGLLAAF